MRNKISIENEIHVLSTCIKKRQKKADVNYTVNALQAISDNEAKEGKAWIDRIYGANGLRRPKNKEERGKVNGGF